MDELINLYREWRDGFSRMAGQLPSWWPRAAAVVLLVLGALLPFAFAEASGFMTATIVSLAYVVMALGLNVVVGFAGLLDLGYVAFYALGAYCVGWFGSGFFFKENIHVLVSSVAGSLPGVHLNFLLILLAAIIVFTRDRRRDHRPADAAPARRLHRDRDAGLRRDHRRVRGQRHRHPHRRRYDADRRQPRHPGAGPALLPRHRTVHAAEPETLVLADLRDHADRPVRQPARARLAPGQGLDRAARGRGGGGLDGDPAGAHEARRVRDGGLVRRHVRRVPGRLRRPPSTRRPVRVHVLDLRAGDDHHRWPRIDLGRRCWERCCSPTSTTT